MADEPKGSCELTWVPVSPSNSPRLKDEEEIVLNIAFTDDPPWSATVQGEEGLLRYERRNGSPLRSPALVTWVLAQ